MCCPRRGAEAGGGGAAPWHGFHCGGGGDSGGGGDGDRWRQRCQEDMPLLSSPVRPLSSLGDARGSVGVREVRGREDARLSWRSGDMRTCVCRGGPGT